MKIPTGITAATGNEMAAYAAIRARVQAISAYPITPNTLILEILAKYFAEQNDPGLIFKNLESEHSMLAHALAMVHMGKRGFTATSSQGFLYALEQLHLGGRSRIPLVMAVVNRSVSNPWNIKTDLNDSMSGSNCGWMQFYCKNQQEVFDTILLAYKVAEKLLLPAMVCFEGFIISHATSRVDLPEQEVTDSFLPPFAPPKEWALDTDHPRSYYQISEPYFYMRHHYEVEKAMRSALSAIAQESRNFKAVFGREKTGLLEISGDPRADTALVTIGSIGDTAVMLAEKNSIRLVRVHTFRPFPYEELEKALAGTKTVAVVDRACSFGAMPPLALEVMATAGRKKVQSFVAGIGGSNVTEKTLEKIIRLSRKNRKEPVWVFEEGRENHG